MKIVKNSFFKKLLIVMLVIIILFNFIMPRASFGADLFSKVTLFDPIRTLICAIGDSIINVLQENFLHTNYKAVDIRSQAEIDANGPIKKAMAKVGNFYANHPIMTAGAFAGAGAAVGALLTGPAAPLGALIGALIGGGVGAGVSAIYGSSGYWTEHAFPVIDYGPMAIFSNKIPIFNINFIQLSTDNSVKTLQDVEAELKSLAENIKASSNSTQAEIDWAEETLRVINSGFTEPFIYSTTTTTNQASTYLTGGSSTATAANNGGRASNYLGGTVGAPLGVIGTRIGSIFGLLGLGEGFTVNQIIRQAELMGIDCSSISDYVDTEESATTVLRNTISKWYVNLRNIAIVGLLSVLVYIGIRILLSSASQEKAKYKTMLKDWFMGMFLVFFMHYMMAFILYGVQLVGNIFMPSEEVDGIMNTIRLGCDSDDLSNAMGYVIMYAMFIFYTCMFTWRYLKRTIYMAFLTMIAPMVAFTYPIDKINDGSAQAFNLWFKEYFFNALIQPVHLILYTILITSAMSLVEANMVYAVVALGFMTQAEKIIKKFFGFNKAEGGGVANGVAAAALFTGGLGLLKQGVGAIRGGGSSKGGNNKEKDNKIRFFNNTDQADSVKNLNAFTSGGSANGGGTTDGGRYESICI